MVSTDILNGVYKLYAIQPYYDTYLRKERLSISILSLLLCSNRKLFR
jgi:hypothetical protein